jgi:hypothetical protein
VERFWLNSRINNADEFIVQTLTMKRLLEVRTKGKIPVKVIPFMANNADYLRKVLPVKTQKKKYFDFSRDMTDYSGRFWKKAKIISFWKYPNKEDFGKIS